ncbi:MAG TPA: hypothetical protein VMB48_13230 [Steroidobacteraceae bacterium]|nr:hypothetical protein [Steroidobacteraceae bacterium]
MKIAAVIAHVLITLSGTALVVLGILFWTGRALSLLPLHMLLGVILVVSLWLAAGLALRAGVSKGLILVAVIWSLIMPALGVAQMQLLPGRLHWTVQLLHLLIGVTAMGLGHALTRRTRLAKPVLA